MEREDFIKQATHEAPTESNNDMGFMHDRFLVLPLRLLEEKGQFDTRFSMVGDLGKWYEEATEYIIAHTYDHGLHCLDGGGINHSCQHSPFCPIRYAADVLTQEVHSDPNDDLTFMMYPYPYQRREVIIRKLEIAARQKLFDGEDYADTVASYDQRYKELFPDNTFQA